MATASTGTIRTQIANLDASIAAAEAEANRVERDGLREESRIIRGQIADMRDRRAHLYGLIY